MGASTSSYYPLDTHYGCHILKVQKNSPGDHAGLVPYFDFIISINGQTLTNENIKEVLTGCLNTEISMHVFSSKSMNVKVKKTFLKADWGGAGILGVSIRYCSFEGAMENVWHVLEVSKHSPASFAGLVAYTDYILGTDVLLDNSNAFHEFIEANDGKVVKLYVYSSVDDDCREVSITPNSKWGNEGMLGCGIGFGYLHRIPVKIDEGEDSQRPGLKITTQNYNILKDPVKNEIDDEKEYPNHKIENHKPPKNRDQPENITIESILNSSEVSSILPEPSSMTTFQNNVILPINQNSDKLVSNVALPGMPPLNVPLNTGQPNLNVPSINMTQMQQNKVCPPPQSFYEGSYYGKDANNFNNQSQMMPSSVPMPPMYNLTQNVQQSGHNNYPIVGDNQTGIPLPNFSENINYTIPPQNMNFNLPPVSSKYQPKYSA